MTKSVGMRRNLAGYGDAGFSVFLRKAFIKALGYTDDALDRPIIGIVDTDSGYNACHRNLPDLIEAASRGVMLAGGIPIPFPVISIQESFAHPTSMYLRNLMAMDVEEMIRAQPMDAVILLGGCDKTVPALIMGAASAWVPAILLVSGPMLAGSWRGERLGACTDCRRFWGRYRAGDLTDQQIAEVNSELAPTVGFCGVMGTASTMALATEALGMMLPGGACVPAVHGERRRLAELTGTRAVAMAAERLTPDQILTPAAFTNALRTVLAAGGSTNALIHLAAMAGRLGIGIDLDGIDRIARETPVLIDLKPTGQGYMEDLYHAGGLVPMLREIAPLLDLSCLTVTGRTLGENLDAAPPPFPQSVIRPFADPIFSGGAMAVLRGNLAPHGAIIKQAAATPSLLQHTGRAVVFKSLADLAARIDDPALDVTPDDVLVMQNAGPKGAPGMPEAGYIPIPKKLLQQGVKDMVRISDARMSGTAFGTIVLHVSPESAIGGPLGLVRDGDNIRLDTAGRTLSLEVDDATLAARAAEQPPTPTGEGRRGYAKLYLDTVTQAERGCDFDFAIPPITRTIP
ncbi:dihydroxy-acid dehydratase [Rhodoplanes serenus]|uniref:Dihydroxy-acid dehydratase n=1 Tax=Rhodoplanes serenus TaxID=200615 RepID=A0A9X4XR16_9BRAD|nr:IlvD/Edd family dehydratase [Rhodoplanes serenus]MTW16961.1 dihydroxy-acid dehydratase [Rhodoplanes serenus]